MAKKYVVVEEDESYLLPFEMKLAEMVGESSDIEIITSSEYFEEYFSAPKTIDVLIIDEANYTPAISRHNIKMTVILTENPDSVSDNNSADHAFRIFKYMKIDTMMKIIIIPDSQANSSKPKMISVISAEGGAGCTTVAIGIAASLSQSMKRVLYINTQEYQNFQYFLKSDKTLPMSACIKLSKAESSKVFSEIRSEILKDGFSYIPPLPSAQYNQGISKSAYALLADAALHSSDYDFVIVDIGTGIQTSEAQIVQKSDAVILLAKQTELSSFKLDVLTKNIDCTDKNKFTLVCNMYDKKEKNELVAKHAVDAYIDRQPETPRKIKQLLLVDGILQLAHSVM